MEIAPNYYLFELWSTYWVGFGVTFLIAFALQRKDLVWALESGSYGKIFDVALGSLVVGFLWVLILMFLGFFFTVLFVVGTIGLVMAGIAVGFEKAFDK